jgi:hypothetical protein
MIQIKLNDLIKIMEIRLSTVLFDSFLDILHPDDGLKPKYERFEYILRNSLNKHLLQFANNMVSPIRLSSKEAFVFQDNFNQYLDDPLNFGEENIILIPNYIINIGYSKLNFRMPISKKYYNYTRPNLLTTISAPVWVTYGSYYPFVINYSPDGSFSDDSTLYYLDSESIPFITRLEYELLIYIKNIQDQIEMPGLAIKILSNLDNQIERVEEELDFLTKTSASMMSFWKS